MGAIESGGNKIRRRPKDVQRKDLKKKSSYPVPITKQKDQILGKRLRMEKDDWDNDNVQGAEKSRVIKEENNESQEACYDKFKGLQG